MYFFILKKYYDYPFRYQNTESSLRIRQPADEAIFISLNTNRLLRRKKHSQPAACRQRQGKGRLAMTYSYILTLGMLADNHIKIIY